MLKTFVITLAVGLAVTGCSTMGTFARVPARYTALPSSPNSESYLIEIVRASGDPIATRYDFTVSGASVTAQISTISKSGARSERRRSDESAKRLLQIFQKFDWSSIEAPLPDDEGIAPPRDDTEVVLKARTLKSYRETQVRLADCAAMRALLRAVDSAK